MGTNAKNPKMKTKVLNYKQKIARMKGSLVANKNRAKKAAVVAKFLSMAKSIPAKFKKSFNSKRMRPAIMKMKRITHRMNMYGFKFDKCEKRKQLAKSKATAYRVKYLTYRK